MSRSKEELQGVTQLGNQHTTYAQDYDPSLLEHLSTSIPTGIISSSSTVPNSPVSAL